MNEAQPPVFDGAAEGYLDHLRTVRGFVRQELVRQNLIEFLPASPVKIIDVGGGDAREGAWLAELGHDVTVLEPEPILAAAGLKRWLSLSQASQRRLHLRAVDLDEALTDSQQIEHYDVVLSHGVLMYQKWPDEHLAGLALLTKPGGRLSLLTKGFYGLRLRLLSNGEDDAAEVLNQTGRWQRNNLGKEVWAHKPEDLVDRLKTLHFEVLDWSGVRSGFSDNFYQPTSKLTAAQLEDIVTAESELGHSRAVRKYGQMIHVIAQKH